MKRFILVCSLAVLASPAFAGNDPVSVLDSPEQMRLLSEYGRQVDSANLRMKNGNVDASRNAQANLIKLKMKLAETWQALGLSPETAKTVAGAYRPRLSPSSQHSSLQDKTDEQFAALMQSSLASGDYQLADQTLIDFVTKKTTPSVKVSSSGHPR